ncbi:uncharacterized protein LOC133995410 [Scomber scombrus]|uniref:uncharacterized protein LOC133995410 n=1 Tax=Scomber scombrus TaxID=13677 RepID=UPI002DDA35BF|nr:uncharacterized protein LOC133995410 [Scomber scombrus]
MSFGYYTNTTVGQVGDKKLIANENLNLDIKMLTIVKVRRFLSYSTKPKFTTRTLLDVLEERGFTPDVTEKVLMEDYDYMRGKSGKGSAAAGLDAAQTRLQVGAAMDTVDGASSTTLMIKKVDYNQLNDKNIKKELLTKLTPNKEMLFCVTQIVYNSSPVTLSSKALTGGSVSALFYEIFRCSLSGNTKREMRFTVPKDKILAYGLEKIKTAVFRNISFDGDDSCKTLEDLAEGILQNQVYLDSLKTFPGSSRRNLLEALREIVPDKDALTLLEETLDEEMTECPQSKVVSEFMDLLRKASSKDQKEADDQRDAVHRLVIAMDSLPDGAAARLTACSNKTLTVLQQLVSRLMRDGQVSLPESLPVSLQEEGLRWAAELLRLTDQDLKELRAEWDRPDYPPEMLLELVCFVVQGLNKLMQP